MSMIIHDEAESQNAVIDTLSEDGGASFHKTQC